MTDVEEPWTHDNAAAGAEAAPELHCATLAEFVELLAELFPHDLDVGDARWCPRWWRHAEAISRLDALWRAFEHLRLDPATGLSTWWRDHADHHVPHLLAPTGPFRRCRNGQCKPLVPLELVPPPPELVSGPARSHLRP